MILDFEVSILSSLERSPVSEKLLEDMPTFWPLRPKGEHVIDALAGTGYPG